MVGAIVAVAVLVVFILIVVGIYNGLVTSRNRYKNAYAQIDVQLKRRYDLIPNLVETAKGYLSHERETLEAVIKARGAAVSASDQAKQAPGDPQAMRQLAGAEGALSATLGRLLALRESYPDLKADGQMSQLSEELTSTENRVAFARQAYNDSVTAYNTSRERFPSILFAGMFGFSQAALLDATESEAERQAPQVSFS